MELSTLKDFEADTRTLVPKFSVKWKNKSLVQKLLGVLLFFNPQYMTGYVTTFYPTVWFSSEGDYEKDPAKSMVVVAHERVHLLDTIRHGVWFKFSYLLPQVLFAPLLLTAIACLIGNHELYALISLVLGLVALAPWPSPWRVQWEKRGYAMSLAAHYWLFGDTPEQLKQSIRTHFLDWSYYKMSRNPKDIDIWLTGVTADIRSGIICSDVVYYNVRRFLMGKGLVKQ
jgi:hypothetical protein